MALDSFRAVDAKNLAKNVIYGFMSGVLYYLVYLYVMPFLLSSAVGLPIEVSSARLMAYLGFFMALGVAEKTLRHPIALPLKVFSKVIGALILMVVANFGVLEGTVAYGAQRISISVDVSPLLYVIVMISLIYGVLDMFQAVNRLDDV
jgi:hypothetical protein